MNCPICTQALEGGELVMVCTPCHHSLTGGITSSLSVYATGEFRVPTSAEIAASEAPDPTRPTRPTRPSEVGACTWCGKLEGQVKKLLGRGGTSLCDECVALASDIMEAELGPAWR